MPSDESLRSSALLLAIAGGMEFGLQMAMPMLLVRHLDETAFAHYRLLWLMAGTALAIAPAFMPQSLFYFLSRAEPGQKRLLVSNVLIYLVAAGCVVGVVASAWNPWLQNVARDLFFATHGMSALFLAAWVTASMLDVLPTADGRIRWQASAIIALALVRTLLLTIAALATADIKWIAFAMLLVAVLKVTLLAFYIHANAGEGKLNGQIATLKRQFHYALPFAIGHTLFLLRVQADQWVVVSMLPATLYATFSVAAAILPVATLIRQPVNNALLPRLNRAYASGDVKEVGRLISKSNGAAALLLIPIAGGLFVAAPELVEIMYTSRHRAAAPVMQVYLIGMMINAVAAGHTLSALGMGRFAAINSAACLVLSVTFAFPGIAWLGLTGAAAASMLGLAFGEVWSLTMVARTLGMAVRHMVEWRALGAAFLGTCIAMASVTVSAGFLNLSPLPMLLAKALIYLISFAPAFFLAGGWKQVELIMGLRRDKRNITEGESHEAV